MTEDELVEAMAKEIIRERGAHVAGPGTPWELARAALAVARPVIEAQALAAALETVAGALNQLRIEAEHIRTDAGARDGDAADDHVAGAERIEVELRAWVQRRRRSKLT